MALAAALETFDASGSPCHRGSRSLVLSFALSLRSSRTTLDGFALARSWRWLLLQ
jgi:hypothetical protein